MGDRDARSRFGQRGRQARDLDLVNAGVKRATEKTLTSIRERSRHLVRTYPSNKSRCFVTKMETW